ncbi:unnamed protein product [Caenorhabditis bovis]|uniref:beta-N-acetylhexosaminidase n=1 Tax=Caenorhabditis bovis TaxID=2654633 RepID=A0A8S1EC42_9PELO|nr:unnamed protein product [Caenorhabditis bovis]
MFQELTENRCEKMIPIRFYRRRSMQLLFKGIVLVLLCLVVVNLTASHPKGRLSVQELNAANKADEILIKKRENADPPIMVPPNEPAPQKMETTKDVTESAASVVINKAPFVRESRKGQFYENVVVHFDLKGAPPKVAYFVDLLKLAAKGGASGILLEWEDMFPWSGELEKFKNTDAYSMKDVETILNTASSLGLDIIPLVQTFGHLEWILKYEETRKYRENDAYPQVLCLGNQEGVNLIKEALRQVIETHKKYGITFMHIGADEAFEFGVCAESREWISKNIADGGKQLLALAHLKNIAEFVKKTAGDETTVLAWHDMLKDFDTRLIKKLELGKVIEPVVWDYSENIVTLNDYIFSSLAENFPTMWASSAFKGANYPSVSFSDVHHYEVNNRNWIPTKRKNERKFQNGFRGIIITGWQRYDHLAGLCEILPMGTPSMILQLQIAITAPNLDERVYRANAAKILECSSFTVAGKTDVISNKCGFPGSNVYMLYQSVAQRTLKSMKDRLGENHHLMGWANRYNRKYNISQNWYHKEMRPFISSMLSEYDNLVKSFRREMSPHFFDNTIEEFIYENLEEMGENNRTYFPPSQYVQFHGNPIMPFAPSIPNFQQHLNNGIPRNHAICVPPGQPYVHTVPATVIPHIVTPHGLIPMTQSITQIEVPQSILPPISPVAHRLMILKQNEAQKEAKRLAKLESMARLKKEREERRALKRLGLPKQKRNREKDDDEDEDVTSSTFSNLTKKKAHPVKTMPFSKDSFVIRLKDIDSFSRSNEIWRVDNHILMQKFTGVPSFRAPARQFQSTNRMSGYDFRAAWRFYVINPENVEFDRCSSEITVHYFPDITILREAKKFAEAKDEEFKNVENDEYREKLMMLQKKQDKSRAERLLRMTERRQRKLEMRYKVMQSKKEEGFKIPKRSIKPSWIDYRNRLGSASVNVSMLRKSHLPTYFKTQKSSSDEESSEYICHQVLNELIEAIIEHEHEECAVSSSDWDSENEESSTSQTTVTENHIYYEDDVPVVGCEVTLT